MATSLVIKLLLLLGVSRPAMPSLIHPIHLIRTWEHAAVTGFWVGGAFCSIATLTLVGAILGLIFLLRWALHK